MQIAESRYRGALLEGWMLRGADCRGRRGGFPTQEEAFQPRLHLRDRSESRAEVSRHRPPPVSEAAEAVEILSRLAGSRGRDLEIVRLLAQALASNGEPELAVQELEEARAGVARGSRARLSSRFGIRPHRKARGGRASLRRGPESASDSRRLTFSSAAPIAISERTTSRARGSRPRSRKTRAFCERTTTSERWRSCPRAESM